MEEAVQVGAALLILAAFVCAQVGAVKTSSLPYLIPNLVGSSVLAIEAVVRSQWGFTLLEGVWALVSAAAAVRTISRCGFGGFAP